MKAKDVMTTNVATATPEMSVRDVAQRMLASGISAMPVVGDDGQVLGMVSEGDLIRRTEIGSDLAQRSWWLRLLTGSENLARDYVKTHGTRVADVMTKSVISVTPETAIGQVALLLEKNRIKRVPVVGQNGLLGIVSRADLLRAFAVAAPGQAPAADDERLRAGLVEHLEKQPWAGTMVNVIVSDGTVNLWGMYDSDDQHEAYLVAAREMPGVRGVEDHMIRTPVS